jgi:hypothetical protein
MCGSAVLAEFAQASVEELAVCLSRSCGGRPPQHRLHVLHVSVCAGPPSAGARTVMLSKRGSSCATMKQGGETMGIPYLGETLGRRAGESILQVYVEG